MIAIIGHCLEGEPIVLFLDLAALGDLRGCLRSARAVDSKPQGFSLSELAQFCHQIAGGMAFLEKQRVLHRDLAARNVLLTTKMVCKVADFGCRLSLVLPGKRQAVGCGVWSG